MTRLGVDDQFILRMSCTFLMATIRPKKWWLKLNDSPAVLEARIAHLLLNFGSTPHRGPLSSLGVPNIWSTLDQPSPYRVSSTISGALTNCLHIVILKRDSCIRQIFHRKLTHSSVVLIGHSASLIIYRISESGKRLLLKLRNRNRLLAVTTSLEFMQQRVYRIRQRRKPSK